MPELSFMDALILVVPQLIFFAVLFGLGYGLYRTALFLGEKAKINLDKLTHKTFSDHTTAH